MVNRPRLDGPVGLAQARIVSKEWRSRSHRDHSSIRRGSSVTWRVAILGNASPESVGWPAVDRAPRKDHAEPGRIGHRLPRLLARHPAGQYVGPGEPRPTAP